MKVSAIIPAGGRGTRLGSSLPKQYIKVNSKEIIAYTLEKFQNSNLVDEIIIPAGKEYFPLLEEIIVKYNLTKVVKIVLGGNERQDSVYNGLLAANLSDDDIVMVHDAARPLISTEKINDTIKIASKSDNCVVALSARDTLVRVSDNRIEYPLRKEFLYVQTPQVFKYGLLKKAMDKAIKNGRVGTDESSIVAEMGVKINFIEGSPKNFKITTTEDLEIFKSLIKC